MATSRAMRWPAASHDSYHPDQRPFPLAPVLALFPAVAGADGRAPAPVGLFGAWLAGTFGLTEQNGRQKAMRLRGTGLTFDQADAVATALEVHPSEIWPQWWALCSG